MAGADPPNLLIIDNAIDHAFYRPTEHWAAAAGAEPASVHPPSGQTWPAPDAFSHAILSGSESSILERAAWAEEEIRWIAEALKAGTRLLGSCWGHQLLAVALAGPGAVRRSPSPEFGWLQVRPTGPDPLLPPEPFWCFSAHFDEVRPDASAKLRILARSAACPVGAMRWAELPVWGIQAHPEVRPELGQAFLQGGRTRWADQASLFEAGLELPIRDDRIASALIGRFLAI